MDQKELLYSQFDVFNKQVIERYLPEVLDESDDIIQDIEEQISDYYRSTLIYLINEKRIDGSLIGSSPESRYNYFTNVLCQQGMILDEIEERFPTITQRVVISLKKYLELSKYVKEAFTADFSELLAEGYLDGVASDISSDDVKIKITGDIHNGNGVCIVAYQGKKVVFKKKSSQPNQLLQTLEREVSQYLDKEVYFISPFLDKGEYFWEKFVSSKPLLSEEEAKEFYCRVGYLLACAYMLNISDLHFENLISSHINPILVDVETVFSTSTFDTIANNDATFKIIESSRDSVLFTGLLPVSEADKVFGGDTSGVLGGIMIGEARIVINHNRDDIRVEKQKYKTENQDHLPYFSDSEGVKTYLNAEDYVDFIKSGFSELSEFFMHRKEFLKTLYSEYGHLQTRLLFRNTRDYSLIRQLLTSPVYCEQSHVLFEKMEDKFSEVDSHELCQSEEKQLLNMDIPYFYAEIASRDVRDDEGIVWQLTRTALSQVIKKLDNLSSAVINEQLDLIEFSIKTPNALYSTELQDAYRDFENNQQTQDQDVLISGINELTDVILENEKNSQEDGSTNWLTLKVTDYDAFELVPMDDSVYDGLAGMAIALSEVYDLVDDIRQEKIRLCLQRIFTTLSNSYLELQNQSYFVGKLGLFSALSRISPITGQELPDFVLDGDQDYLVDLDVSTADFLSSFTNEVVALRNSDIKIGNLNQALDKLDELKIISEDFISWDKLESNNVSLAHGNLGVEVALLCLAGNLERPEALQLFRKAKRFDDRQRLENGWVDKRNSDTSANWCHGSTGVLVARLVQLRLDDRYKLLLPSERTALEADLQHASKQIIDLGFDMTNFSLCHGTSGNLLALSYYQSYLPENDAQRLRAILDKEYRKLHAFGLTKGWMCSFNTKYNVYGLMTGLPGILYSTAKFLKGADSLDVLIPNL